MFKGKIPIILVSLMLAVFSFAGMASAVTVNMGYNASEDSWSGINQDSVLYCDFYEQYATVQPLSSFIYTNIEFKYKLNAAKFSWVSKYNPNKLSFNGYSQSWGPNADIIIQSLSDGYKKCIVLWPYAYAANTEYQALINWKNKMSSGSSYTWKDTANYWCLLGPGDASQLLNWIPIGEASYITIWSRSSSTHSATDSDSATDSVSYNTRLKGKTDFSKAEGTVKFMNEDGEIIYQTTVQDVIKRHDEIEKNLKWKF